MGSRTVENYISMEKKKSQEIDCGAYFVTFPIGKLFLDQFLGLFLLKSQEFSGIK